ncbi:MAG: HIT domain-containing protein [Thermoplasmata archaeon]|jgi:ATP adenylyltransferase|nr:HIT domain-containing protein [Thermoplasmata archaeon]MVT14331.1 HIT domain-containing protein [Euryarchaeota archaeon]MVT35245.1 HIT domain-containing protein [Euryarchaeota archaeon]
MDFLYAPWRIRYIESPKKEEGCIFCKAASEPDGRYVLHNDGVSFVIMNIFPYNPGHLMVAPIRHVGSFSELTNEEILSIGNMVKKSMDVLKKTMNPEGFNIGVNIGLAAGAGIRDHIHVHIVPRWCGDTNFMPVTGDTKVLSEALDELYKKLKNNW